MLLISGRAGSGACQAPPDQSELPQGLLLPPRDLPEYRIYSQARGNRAGLRRRCPPQAHSAIWTNYGSDQAVSVVEH